MKMLLRVIWPSDWWLGVAIIIEPSFYNEGWRHSAIFAVETATSHSRGDHLAAVWQVGEGASPHRDVLLICGQGSAITS